MKIRLENAIYEIEGSSEPFLFDKVLVNEDYQDAVTDIFRTLRRWYFYN